MHCALTVWCLLYSIVHRTLVVSSFGKLLAIAAVIWAETHSAIYLLFTHLLVLSSNIAAFRGLQSYHWNEQEAQLSPSDRAMRLVISNLANYHAAVQKLLIRQVLTKPMVWSCRFSWRQCVINKQCRNCSCDPDHAHLGNTHSSQD